MSKMGARCCCTKQKGHTSQHSKQPFLTHFQRSDFQKCLAGEIHEFHGCSHQWLSWETKPVRHSSKEPQTGEGDQPTLQAQAWQLNFNILSHFPAAFLCFQMGNAFRAGRGALQWICSASGWGILCNLSVKHCARNRLPNCSTKGKAKPIFSVMCTHLTAYNYSKDPSESA